jgi:tRNA uridine 5-carboxymethylaminomethyl modification enzyme
MDLDSVERLAHRCGIPLTVSSDPKVREQLALAGAYDGYIQRQERLADKAKRLEDMRIPDDFGYGAIVSLSSETREKLTRIRPTTLGQASRVPGVRPSDIALLIGHIFGNYGVSTIARGYQRVVETGAQ